MQPYSFTTILFKSGGKGAWTFAKLPKSLDFEATEAFGRTPVIATFEGREWKTSLWREKSGDTLIALPKKIRNAKEEGDEVTITFVIDTDRIAI